MDYLFMDQHMYITSHKYCEEKYYSVGDFRVQVLFICSFLV